MLVINRGCVSGRENLGIILVSELEPASDLIRGGSYVVLVPITYLMFRIVFPWYLKLLVTVQINMLLKCPSQLKG